MKLTKISLLCACLVVFAFSTVHARTVNISKSEFGDRWPFTVSQGELSCTVKGVTFFANGKTYAVNGTARHYYPKINKIWKDDQKQIQILKESFPGEKLRIIPKMSIGPILEMGLSLCK